MGGNVSLSISLLRGIIRGDGVLERETEGGYIPSYEGRRVGGATNSSIPLLFPKELNPLQWPFNPVNYAPHKMPSSRSISLNLDGDDEAVTGN